MSTGRTCKEMQEYLNNNTEHECFTAFAQGIEDEYSFCIGNIFDWKLHGLFSRLSGRQGSFSHYGTMCLIKKMKEIQPDIVILRNLHGNYINIHMLLSFLAKNNIATIAVLHDCWFFTGKCTHYTLEKCYKWESGCYHCTKLKADNPSWIFDATPALWRKKKMLFEKIPRFAVVGVSDWITNEARRSYLKSANIIMRIYNWIDLNVFAPQSDYGTIKELYKLEQKKIILGVASSWASGKGLESFIKLRETLNSEYIIVLVGAMPKEISLPKGMIAIPPTRNPSELAKYYSMADVFVTLSKEESFGKVSAEALACGTPVVCFDSTANKELIKEGCGLAVEVENLWEMSNAIELVCSLPKETYRKKCREFAQKQFSKEECIQNYMELFKRIGDKEVN